MAERRYNEDEAAAIFRAATEGSEAGALPGSTGEGLTIGDLQAIAREVDIAPDAIARAAQSLDVTHTPAVKQTLLGVPVAVERSVELPRRLTDPEWELLVVELRQVFNARGTVRGYGSLREWSNGNLNVMLEPTATGHQLRMRTVKGNARSSILAGGAAIAMAGVMAGVGAASGALASMAPGMAVVATVGAAIVVSNVGRLPSWARRRREQMDGIAARLLDQVHSR